MLGVFFLVKVLVQARFQNSKATDLKFLTVILATVNQTVQNFSSLGASG
jgi:hypothetical protein